MAVGHLDGVERLGERAYLVDLDENGVACAHLDALGKEVYVGHEEVVAHQLAAVADGGSELHPVVPVVLVESVLYGVDGILGYQLLKILYLLVGRELATVGVFLLSVLQLAVVIEPLAVFLHSKLAGCAVHGYGNVLARLVACVADGLADAVEGVLDAVQCGGESTLVAHGRREPAALKQLCQGMEHLGAHAYGLAL